MRLRADSRSAAGPGGSGCGCRDRGCGQCRMSARKPVSIFIVVDLPAPLGRGTNTSPRWTRNDRSSTAVCWAKRLVRLLISIMGSHQCAQGLACRRATEQGLQNAGGTIRTATGRMQPRGLAATFAGRCRQASKRCNGPRTGLGVLRIHGKRRSICLITPPLKVVTDTCPYASEKFLPRWRQWSCCCSPIPRRARCARI